VKENQTADMKTYINQLLRDIESAAAADPSEVPGFGLNPDSFEAYILEVERFIHEDPVTTLGKYLGLERVQFPEDNQLTEQQCAAVFDALTNAYASYGVALEIPEGIPVRICYRTAVEALEKAVFVSGYGMYHIEYCHYDFDGYCPFGVERCPCFITFEREQGNESKCDNPIAQEIRYFDSTWYRLLTDLADARRRLEIEHTANRVAVRDICQILDLIWITVHRDDYIIYYHPKPSDVPGTPGRTLAEWANCPPLVFPPFDQLHPLEAELLTLAMIRVLGKEHVALSAMALKQPELYDALVRHLGCELQRDETVEHWKFVCPPGQPTLHEFVKEVALGKRGDALDDSPPNNGDLPL
jgi:hypothetical protein